jgi:hypothetical protein
MVEIKLEKMIKKKLILDQRNVGGTKTIKKERLSQKIIEK